MSLEKLAADAFLKALEDRFKNKINPSEYALSYSGGKDSHFLYWFIKEWLGDKEIAIVGVNTGMELPEIRDRILSNSDVILHPGIHRDEVKKLYGIPCFSKKQDDYIHRYQNGNRSTNTMKYILGENPKLNLNKRGRQLLLDGKLHKISNMCCAKTKEQPLAKWQRKNGRKPIIGVRGEESMQRENAYQTCLHQSGSFTPLYDWTSEQIDLVYRSYNIEIPRCYQYLTRTGCGGCPYGRNIETELAMMPRLQRMSAINYFRESYDVLGVEYRYIQTLLGYE